MRDFSQPKVMKLVEYFVYFPISLLNGWGKRPAAQPQPIYSEVPKVSKSLISDTVLSGAKAAVARSTEKSMQDLCRSGINCAHTAAKAASFL